MKFAMLLFSFVFCIPLLSSAKTTSIQFKLDSFYADEESPYLYQLESVCYSGEIGEVPSKLMAMIESNVLHMDQGVLAIRFADKKLIFSEEEFFETSEDWRELQEDLNPEVVEDWKNYDVTSDAVLVISNLGPQGDGTELYGTFIGPCK